MRLIEQHDKVTLQLDYSELEGLINIAHLADEESKSLAIKTIMKLTKVDVFFALQLYKHGLRSNLGEQTSNFSGKIKWQSGALFIEQTGGFDTLTITKNL